MADPTDIPLTQLREMHPADLADHLQRLPLEEAKALLLDLPRSDAAAVISELELDHATELLGEYTPAQLSDFLQELPPNEAADLAGELDRVQQDAVLDQLPSDASGKIRALLQYPEDTAGGIMSDRFIALRENMTVQQCQDLLRSRAEDEEDEDVSYLYVTDPGGRLVGVVSIRDLLFRKSDRLVGQIMHREVTAVRVSADQEEIVREFEHYHYLGLPVLEEDGRLVGVVRANDVIGIMQDEATEDMQLMVGLSGEERALTPWQRSVRNRLPWLYVNLATAFLAASVVAFFEDIIARWTVLAVFLPIVAGQGGNAGAQTLTVIIRDLALGEMNPGDGRKALTKELILGLINGMAIGLVVGTIGYLWEGNPVLGVIVGVAMVLNMLAAALSGVLVPYGLKALRIDPALASSILVTTVTDVAGFFFFLGLAALAIRWL